MAHTAGVITHSCLRHDSFVCETGLVHMWDMTHFYARHDVFIHMCDALWMVHIADVMTHSYVRHDSSICETWLISMRDMTYLFTCVTLLYVRHHSFICETWLSLDGTYGRCHVSFTCETWLIHMWDMTYSHMCRSVDGTYGMRWLRLVGSIKPQVSFAKEPYKRDNILPKIPTIESILLTVATP